MNGKANDLGICRRLGNLLVDGQRLAERPIGRITSDDIEQLFAGLTDLAGSTWNKYRDALRMMQAWGVRKGYLQRPWFDDRDTETAIGRKDSAKRDRRLQPDVVNAEGKVIHEGEERRLLAGASPCLQRLIIAALESACRCGELLSLQWADVDLTRPGADGARGEVEDRQARQVPVSQKLLAVLQLVRHDPAGHLHPPGAYVFGNAVSERVTFPKKHWETVRLRAHGHELQWSGGKLAPASRAALQQTDLHFHDLRHEAGSRWADAKMPLSHVQRMLGHADLEMTSDYLNADLHHLQDSMRRFEITQPLHVVAQETEIEPPTAVQRYSRGERESCCELRG